MEIWQGVYCHLDGVIFSTLDLFFPQHYRREQLYTHRCVSAKSCPAGAWVAGGVGFTLKTNFNTTCWILQCFPSTMAFPVVAAIKAFAFWCFLKCFLPNPGWKAPFPCSFSSVASSLSAIAARNRVEASHQQHAKQPHPSIRVSLEPPCSVVLQD